MDLILFIENKSSKFCILKINQVSFFILFIFLFYLNMPNCYKKKIKNIFKNVKSFFGGVVEVVVTSWRVIKAVVGFVAAFIEVVIATINLVVVVTTSIYRLGRWCYNVSFDIFILYIYKK